MGMSLTDFDRCTPLEFEKIFEMWHGAQEQAIRNGWEQTRQLAVCILQPFAKKELRPRDVMEFAWDQKPAGERRGKKRTREELEADKQHYEEVKKARGLE